MRLRRLVLSVAVASTAIAACVGDAPSTGTTPDSTPDDAGRDSSFADSSTGADTSLPPVDGAADGAAAFDAGPPAWTGSLPTGATTTLASAGDAVCTFDVVSVQTANAPPKYQLFLRKQDALGAICNEPKGIRPLDSGTTPPNAALLKPQGTNHLVLAYSMKTSPSGSAPEILTVTQVDWPTGNDLRTAVMKAKAVVGIPATPNLTLVQLFFGDPTEAAAGTVRLKGTGSFPGESGIGMFFNATYVGFIGAVGQPPAAADTCLRSD